MVAAVDTMAYAGATPWHKLGVQVGPDMMPDDMLVAAGLDWDVEVIDFPTIPGIAAFNDHRMLVKRNPDEDDTLLDIVGTRYNPIQNVDVLSFFDKYVRAGNMTMETAGSLKNGKFVWALAKTKDGFCLPGGDAINGYLLLVSPHQRGFSFTAKFTPTRVVCWNTMSYALASSGLTQDFRMSHSRVFDNTVVRDIEATLGLSKNIMATYEEQAALLAKTKITEPALIEFLASVFEPNLSERLAQIGKAMPKTLTAANDLPKVAEIGRGRKREEVKILGTKSPLRRAIALVENNPGHDLKSARGTYWGAFNIVTFGFDHVLGHSNENRAYKSMNVAGAIKQKALSMALEMAQAA